MRTETVPATAAIAFPTAAATASVTATAPAPSAAPGARRDGPDNEAHDRTRDRGAHRA